MVFLSSRSGGLRRASAFAGSCAVGFAIPIVGMGFTLGGSYMSERFLQTLVIAAVCLAAVTHFVIGGTRRRGTLLTHLVGIAGGLLVPVLLATAWPRVARERAEFAASYKTQLVPGAVRVATAFTIIWVSVLVAVALAFFISWMRREPPGSRSEAQRTG